MTTGPDGSAPAEGRAHVSGPRGWVEQLSARDLAARYVGVLLDLDGVCYRGSKVLPGVADGIARLRDVGIALRFVTNNSTRTPEAVVAHLAGFGITASSDEVVTSSQATADLLAPGTRCFLIGMDGVREALTARGCVVEAEGADAEAVVVGMDTALTWSKLCEATTAIDRGARFLGTNADVSFPVAEGLWPGNGAILTALTAATGVEPEVGGKPFPPLFERAARDLGPGPLLMVGDRPDTDIVGAQQLGWDTLLVLSGVADRETADRLVPPPTLTASSLAVIGP
jgi:glycerol-1-phosphatase